MVSPHSIGEISRHLSFYCIHVFRRKNPCLHSESFDDDDESCFPADTHSVSSKDSVAGYDHPVLYHHAPRTPYQAWLRQGLSPHARVIGHYTGILPAIVVERTVNIAMEAGASHLCMYLSLFSPFTFVHN